MNESLREFFERQGEPAEVVNMRLLQVALPVARASADHAKRAMVLEGMLKKAFAPQMWAALGFPSNKKWTEDERALLIEIFPHRAGK